MILAVDCGSTNLKGALFTPDLERRAVAAVPVRYLRQDAERTELDPFSMWNAFCMLTAEVLKQAQIRISRISMVAFGSQAQTFTLLDSHDRPLLPFLSWMDQRATAEAAEWRNRLCADFHRHCSFPVPLPALQISLLLWVRRNCPEVWRSARRLVSLPGYFALRLSGVHALDVNLASMEGLFSMVTRFWRREVLDYLDLPSEWLPQLSRPGERIPAMPGRAETPWPEWRPAIVLCGNDQTVGALGNDVESRSVVVTFGTALVAYQWAGMDPGPYHPSGIWGPFPTTGYYELGVWGEGGIALDWARERLLPGRTAADFDQAAGQAEPGSGGLLFFPERARGDAAWRGKGRLGECCRAVLEGILFALRHLLEDDLGIGRDRALCAIGGGSRSGFWMQLAADITGRVVRRGTGDGLLGSALLAAGCRRPPSSGECAIFEPNPSHRALYEERYARWRAGWNTAQ